MDWYVVGRPGNLGSRRQEVIRNYDLLFGKGQWKHTYRFNDILVKWEEVVDLYEQAYWYYFQNHPDELLWIASNASEVFDNDLSNIDSGLDYNIQEKPGHHLQDIAIRRILRQERLEFLGDEPLEIRMQQPGVQWNPGRLHFHDPNLIPFNEIQGWWRKGSIESFYQNARYLEAKAIPKELDADILFVTGNKGKVASAQIAIPDWTIGQLKLDISEDQEDIYAIATHKAKVARSVTCRPIIVDDSGFMIPGHPESPGHHVGRILKEKGLQYFNDLAREGPLDAYWEMVVAFYDHQTPEPMIFSSEVHGKLIAEQRGDPEHPLSKSPLGLSFIVDGQGKTINEMSETEYRERATTERWAQLVDYLQTEHHNL